MLTEKFSEAVALAVKAHDGQYRKVAKTIPYISHPLAVASICLEFGGNEDQAIAALLHDVLEDGGLHYEAEILEKFGENVHDIVKNCTDGTPDDNGKKLDWYARKTNYLNLLESVNEAAILVITADKLHNVRSILQDLDTIGESVFDRFKTKKEGTLWYYRSVADVLHRRLKSPITRILCDLVLEMEEFKVTDVTHQ